MNTLEKLLNGFNWDLVLKTSFRVTLLLFLAWIATKLLHKFLQGVETRMLKTSKEEGEPPSESQKRIETIVRLIRQALLLALWLTISLMLLKELGVEIGPIIASAGVVGFAVGFGAQNLVRDIIAGFFIILENQIRVGDVAVINGSGGLVEKINFRTTVLRDLAGIVHIFPNGTISTLSNLTKEWSAHVFEIGVAYKEDTDQVVEVMRQVGRDLYLDEAFGRLMLGEPEIFGVDKLGDSAVIIKGRIKTRPIRQWEVGREYLRRIKYAFDASGIEIPFPHRSLYVGADSKPLELRILEQQTKGQAQGAVTSDE